jgi:Zn ribbon nucleic-acid-binding protein
MCSENFPYPNEDVAQGLRMAAALDAGILDGIPCPRCHQNSVSVWFSQGVPGQYRTWFVCNNCGFARRIQNVRRPELYSEARIDNDLEMYDESVLKKKRMDERP